MDLARVVRHATRGRRRRRDRALQAGGGSCRVRRTGAPGGGGALPADAAAPVRLHRAGAGRPAGRSTDRDLHDRRPRPQRRRGPAGGGRAAPGLGDRVARSAAACAGCPGCSGGRATGPAPRAAAREAVAVLADAGDPRMARDGVQQRGPAGHAGRPQPGGDRDRGAGDRAGPGRRGRRGAVPRAEQPRLDPAG